MARAPGRLARAGARLGLCVLLLALTPLAAWAQAQSSAAEPPQAPILRVEAGAHTAPVARLATDASGRVLASVSDDKTLRLWSLPGGEPISVIRPPIGEREEGELFAVALSPDGGRAFVGGFTARSWDSGFAIYMFDTSSGRLVGRLPNLPAPINHLALSADGGRLAAALGGRAGIRVWDARNGRLLFADETYAGPARMVAFDAAGRLASTAADGRVRLYDPTGRKLAERAPVANGRPFGLAWSPDGTLLAIGFEDRIRVEVLAANDLRTLLVPEVAGLAGEGLPAVAWASDGRGGIQLHAAGYARVGAPAANLTRAPAAPQQSAQVPSKPGEPPAGSRGLRVREEAPATAASTGGSGFQGEFVIRRWLDFGLGPSVDIPAARDAIAHLLPLPGGGLAYAAADPGWGRLAPDGALALAPRPPGADFRATGMSLAIAPDGQAVRFAMRADAPPMVFDPARGRLEAREGADFLLARQTTPRLPMADWRNSNRPRLGNQMLRIGEGEFARSAAILPKEDGFLLGTDTHLRLFDAAGRPRDSLALPGTAWGLAVAGDVAVAALGDGTLRWYDIGPRITERAALFVHADGQRWALWTPEGLFDHAAQGGQNLVGVHLNQGRNATPDWASFQQAYRALYAPLAVRARVAGDPAPARERMAELGDVRARIGRAPTLAAGTACAVTAGGCVPMPWNSSEVPVDASALRLTFVATDRGLGLGPLDVLVNDRIAARAEPGVGEASVEVPLDPGPNRIATRLYADDRTMFAEGPALLLRRPGEAPPPAASGRLILVAVGIDEYAVAELNLRFAVADARTVAESLRSHAGGVFREVLVTLLTDRDATRRKILDALATAANQARPEDTFVLYMAGHGVRSEPDRRFLFLPHDMTSTADWAAIRRTALDEDTLVAALARIRARDGFLFIDTCHAGQVTIDSLAAMGNDTGRFLLAASTSVQEALDSYDNANGVFAYAIREALAGRAASDGDGRISALAVGEYVTRRVPGLAAEKQHRQDAVFRTAQRDLRSFPLARVAR